MRTACFSSSGRGVCPTPHLAAQTPWMQIPLPMDADPLDAEPSPQMQTPWTQM